MLVVMTGLLADIYDALIAEGGLLEDAVLELWGVPVEEKVAWDNDDRPVFTGYAPATIENLRVIPDENGVPMIVGDIATFKPDNATGLPVLVYGASVVTEGGDIAASSQFPSPLPLNVALQELHVTPHFRLGGITDPGMHAYGD